jgi:hypothetical protein
MRNYLASNDYRAEADAATLAALPPEQAAVYEQLLDVRAAYLGKLKSRLLVGGRLTADRCGGGPVPGRRRRRSSVTGHQASAWSISCCQ